MKKKTVILLLLMMLVFTVSCGKEKEETSETDTETLQETGKEDKKKDKKKEENAPKPTEEVIIDEDPFVNESLNAYSDFIDGKLKAVANDINMLDDGEYTFDGLADNKAVNLGREYLPDIITEGYFAYIDCGMDGIPELALKLYYTDSNEYASPYTDYTVIKYDGDGKLRVVCSENTYYRSESNINEYGYITSGGSTGAASYYAEESFITADGREVLILSDHCEMGLSDLTIPQDCLSTSLEKVLSNGYGPDGDYSLNCYLLEEYNMPPYNEDTWDKDYTDYVRERFYVFEDFDGNICVPEADYVNLCRDNGIRIFGKDSFEKLLNKHYEDIGFDEKIISGKDIEWTETSVADRVSKSAQIKEFVDNSGMWYLDPSKIDQGNEVAYLIADLNRNGRYELIRSERLADNPENTEFCRNRFFEINEDYSGIYKMEYEVETMWANGELSGWSHDLLRADRDYLDCYWNEEFGSALDDYSVAYFYIVPTLMKNDTSLMENKMVLRVDGKKSVKHGMSVGMADLKYNRYTDEGGFESNKEYYDNAGNICYRSEDGWNHDKVYILYEKLDDTNKSEWEDLLLESANAYFYSKALED